MSPCDTCELRVPSSPLLAAECTACLCAWTGWGSYGGARAKLAGSTPASQRPLPEAAETLLAATWAAVLTTLATNPLDTLKTRYQVGRTAPRQHSSMD